MSTASLKMAMRAPTTSPCLRAYGLREEECLTGFKVLAARTGAHSGHNG
jgi:hypothetical protein